MTPIALRAAAVLAIGALAVPALGQPGDMSVAAFLAKADALRGKGAMALFSPDLKRLKAEGQAAGQAYRSRLMAERKAGKPSSCPPKGAKVDSAELIAFLRRYPAEAQARTPMKSAMADYFIRTYPCP